MLDMKEFGNITILVAHPDDELLWCWPALHHATKIVACSDDRNNPERQWCAKRGEVLEKIGKILGVEVVRFGYPSGFYQLPTRDETLSKALGEFGKALEGADTVFTHNPWGEYGHIDHMLVHQVAVASRKVVLFTDIFEPSNWVPWKNMPVYGGHVTDATIDMDLYERCKALYDEEGCWTWSKPPVQKCEVLTP